MCVRACVKSRRHRSSRCRSSALARVLVGRAAVSTADETASARFKWTDTAILDRLGGALRRPPRRRFGTEPEPEDECVRVTKRNRLRASSELNYIRARTAAN